MSGLLWLNGGRRRGARRVERSIVTGALDLLRSNVSWKEDRRRVNRLMACGMVHVQPGSYYTVYWGVPQNRLRRRVHITHLPTKTPYSSPAWGHNPKGKAYPREILKCIAVRVAEKSVPQKEHAPCQRTNRTQECSKTERQSS